MNIQQVNYSIYDISRMTNTHHMAYMKRAKERAFEYIVTQLGEQAPAKLKTAAQDLMQAYTNEDAAYLLTTKSALTEQLAEADRQRDGLLAGLRAMCDALLHLGTDEQKAAAQKVVDQLTLYKLRADLKYEDEGIKMDQFLSDCQSNFDLKKAIRAIGQEATVEQMKTANDEAMRLVNMRKQERALTDMQRLNKARLVTDDAYQTFATLLNAYAAIEADETGFSQYDLCIRVMNEDIRYYRTMVAAKPAKSNGTTPATEPTEPATDGGSNADGNTDANGSGAGTDTASQG